MCLHSHTQAGEANIKTFALIQFGVIKFNAGLMNCTKVALHMHVRSNYGLKVLSALQIHGNGVRLLQIGYIVPQF